MKKDIHSETAKAVFGNDSPEARRAAKTLNFGKLYMEPLMTKYVRDKYLDFDTEHRVLYYAHVAKGRYLLTRSPLKFTKNLVVSDPCYNLTINHCQFKVENLKPGTYYPVMIADNEVITEIAILHSDISGFGKAKVSDWQLIEDVCICVDSGQVGFFDFDKYAEKQMKENFESFYEAVGQLTLGRFEDKNVRGYLGHGVIEDWGFVSQTAYGDGTYQLFKIESEGEVIGLRVVFVDEAEDEEEED